MDDPFFLSCINACPLLIANVSVPQTTFLKSIHIWCWIGFAMVARVIDSEVGGPAVCRAIKQFREQNQKADQQQGSAEVSNPNGAGVYMERGSISPKQPMDYLLAFGVALVSSVRLFKPKARASKPMLPVGRPRIYNRHPFFKCSHSNDFL